MVWIKISDTVYQNSELITSIYITPSDIDNEVSIVSICGEFGGESYPIMRKLWSASFEPMIDPNSNSIGAEMADKDLDYLDEDDYDETYNEKMREKLSETAREILVRLLHELGNAKKNGDIIFDLEAFLNTYNITN